MSKCRLETVMSSHGPTHLGNSMCFSVPLSRSSNCKNKTQIRWCDFTQEQPFLGVCNHCLYFPMSVCASPPLCFSSPVGSWCSERSVETNILCRGMNVCPLALGDQYTALNYVCLGAIFRLGMAMLWRGKLWKGLRVRLDSSTPLCHTEVSLPLDKPRLTMPIVELALQYDFWGLWSPSCRSKSTVVIRGPPSLGRRWLHSWIRNAIKKRHLGWNRSKECDSGSK